MTIRDMYIKELREVGVLSYEDFEKQVEKYEPYTDKLADSDLMAYFISRGKIEALSQAFMLLENPVALKAHLLSSIEGNISNIHAIKAKLDKIVRS
jgi:hypothetical protein